MKCGHQLQEYDISIFSLWPQDESQHQTMTQDSYSSNNFIYDCFLHMSSLESILLYSIDMSMFENIRLYQMFSLK